MWWVFKLFPWDALKPKGKFDKRFFIRMAILIVVVVALLYACGTCNDCTAVSGRGTSIDRTPVGTSEFFIVFDGGRAIAYWIDSTDYNFDHTEISWEPGGLEPVKIPKGIGKHIISGLEEGIEYHFTVKAVDKWENPSGNVTGTAYMQRRVASASATERSSIKGIPVARQATVSWTNLDDLEYEYVEVSCVPGYRTPIRVHKGVGSKMFRELASGSEHTFYVAAVDARGNRKPLNELGLYIPDQPTSPDTITGRSSGGQIIVEWNDPPDPQLNRIEVVHTPNVLTPITVDAGVQTRRLTGFSDVRDVEFTVYAVDSAGRRRPLTGVSLLTPELPLFDGRDSHLYVVKGTPVDGRIMLNWDDPAMANLDHVIVRYRLNEGASSRIFTEKVEKGKETLALTGLPDREHLFMAHGVDTRANNRVIDTLRVTTTDSFRLVARPVSGKVTLVWNDPTERGFQSVEMVYNPGGSNPVRVNRGVENSPFTGLSDNQEYEFFVTAITSSGRRPLPARAIVPQLPTITGTPVNGQLSLGWNDPPVENIDHIEISYFSEANPENVRVQRIENGEENQTFSNLTGNSEYTFTLYGVDNIGNKHAVESARFLNPNAYAISEFERTGVLGVLDWKRANTRVFGDSSINAFAFGSTTSGVSRWVAGGSEGRLAYSVDAGLNWILASNTVFGHYSVDAICYSNGRWVAGGKDGRMAWSANGITWSAVSKNQPSNSNVNSIAFGNDRWIAGCNDGIIMVSDDNGANWRLLNIEVFGDSGVTTVMFYNGRWVAGASGGMIAYSDNGGLSWTLVRDSTFGNSAINTILYSNGRWLAGGYAPRSAYSTDGINWRTLTRPFYILTLGYNGIRWLAGGQEGRIAWSGNGGDTWTMDELAFSHFGEDWVHAVSAGRSSEGARRWLAGGQNGKIIYADEK
ncbi:MAG: hypothetical protein LBI06_07050 [Treponema sp.]|jgi:hypothetical protein|nr:hypothetical protein [Treponema sp.]